MNTCVGLHIPIHINIQFSLPLLTLSLSFLLQRRPQPPLSFQVRPKHIFTRILLFNHINVTHISKTLSFSQELTWIRGGQEQKNLCKGCSLSVHKNGLIFKQLPAIPYKRYFIIYWISLLVKHLNYFQPFTAMNIFALMSSAHGEYICRINW